ncbi:MAG: biotin--[acetyl-CoA-carboxylase] ligase [Pirellulales bacterium]|nr:biotin--[acetyl-CoA-carboxylase] ligase [Pirellulales bacterium]
MPQFDVSRIVRETFVRQVDYHPVVDSTNTKAAEWAKCGKALLPLLVLADRQTAGRGRGTNRWWTGEGSLAFSLLIDESWMPRSSCQFPMLGLATGIAVVEVMQRFLQGHCVDLLWPNDVVVADRKLGGILVEGDSRRFTVIGVGVNVNNSLRDAPADLQPLAVSVLDLTGLKDDLTGILIGILRRLEIELKVLRDDKGFKHRPPYCLPQNEPVQISGEEGISTGICRGIRSDGAIVVETADGMRSVHARSIQFGSAAQ